MPASFAATGIGLAAGDAERDQVLGAADGGEPGAGLVTLILAGALPRRQIGQERTRLRVIEGAGQRIVDSTLALAGRGRLICGAGPLHRC